MSEPRWCLLHNMMTTLNILTLLTTYADRYSNMWQKTCHIFVLNFTHLNSSFIKFSSCHTVWFDKLSGRLDFWQRWMNITPRGKRSVLVCYGPDRLTGVVLPTHTRRGLWYSAIKRLGMCVVTSRGHVVYQFDLQGMSVRPCWPDSVLAVTHLLLCLP